MSNYVVLKEEEIIEKFSGKEKDVELIQYILEGELLKKKFDVSYQNIQEVENTKSEKEEREAEDISDFQDLRMDEKIVTAGFDFKKIEEGIAIFPYFNEREEDYYNNLFSDVKMTPPKGYFWYVDTDIENSPFGVYKTNSYIAKVTRKPSDFRFDNVMKLRNNPKNDEVYEDEKEFYFDYQNEKYVQVTVKYVKDGSPANPDTEELDNRKRAIRYIMKRFSIVLKSYRLFLEKNRDQLVKSMSGMVSSTNGYKNIYKLYLSMLNEAAKIMPLKLILGQITAEEYEVLMKEIGLKKVELYEYLAIIEDVLEKENVSEVIFNQGEWVTKYMQLYDVLGSKDTLGYLKNIKSFITKKQEYDKSPIYNTVGYIVVRDELNKAVKLVPNIITVETRDFYTEFQSSSDKITEYERKVLEYLNKEKTDNVPNVVKLFTAYEINKIVNLKNTGNNISVKNMVVARFKEEKDLDSDSYNMLYQELMNYLNGKYPRK
jgi:hypothetical protein